MAKRGGAKVGRPSEYTDAIAAEICERLTRDEGLRAICDDERMPSLTTVYRWRHENGQFREQYARAREDQGHTVADGIGDIRRALLRGELDHQAARAAADMAKWEASRRAAKDYGEKLDLTSSDGTMTPPTVAQFWAKPTTLDDAGDA